MAGTQPELAADDRKASTPDIIVQSTLGDVTVSIEELIVDAAELKSTFSDSGGSVTKERLTLVRVRLENLTGTKKIEYDTWAPGETTSLDKLGRLFDEFDNYDKPRRRPEYGLELPGAIVSESIYPQSAVSDALLFDRPSPPSDTLVFMLPGGTRGCRRRVPIEDSDAHVAVFAAQLPPSVPVAAACTFGQRRPASEGRLGDAHRRMPGFSFSALVRNMPTARASGGMADAGDLESDLP